MFICGSASFDHKDEDKHPNEPYSSKSLSLKRSKRSTSFCRLLSAKNSNAHKNPYADRGLDKFNALLADLDGKKHEIYTRMGSEDISFVQFVYTHEDSDRVKPIIVKVKDKKAGAGDSMNLIKRPAGIVARNERHADQIVSGKKEGAAQLQLVNNKVEEEHESNADKESKKCPIIGKGMSFKLQLEDLSLRQPYFYLPVMVLLIMVFLAVFGRSFAILCTSIGWYLVPGLGRTGNYSEGKSKRKKKKQIAPHKVQGDESGHPSSPKGVTN